MKLYFLALSLYKGTFLEDPATTKVIIVRRTPVPTANLANATGLLHPGVYF
jgi:hypothetical protein